MWFAGGTGVKVRKMVTVSDPAARVINAAHNRILRYHNDREQVATKQRPNGGVLYHYTTAERERVSTGLALTDAQNIALSFAGEGS